MKTYSEARIELQFYNSSRKCWKSRVSKFLSSDQPSEPKSLDVAMIIAGVENYAKKTCNCGQPGGQSIRVFNRKEH